jgi:predicted GTPase
VADAYKGMIVAVNKWDLLEDTDDNRLDFAKRILGRLRFTPWRRWRSCRRRRG